MLLCNAIVGNYNECNYSTISDRLSMENSAIVAEVSDLNYLYVIFRVVPSDKDESPKSNQGLVIHYNKTGKSQGNNIKSHFLVPIYNEYGKFCYWISSKYLRVRKNELFFKMSYFIKEYWKEHIYVEEFINENDNNNVLYFGVREKDYSNYNRVIHIEREGKTQIVCVNLQFRNKGFVIVENILEPDKSFTGSSPDFDGNNTIKEFYLSQEREQDEQDSNGFESAPKSQETSLERQQEDQIVTAEEKQLENFGNATSDPNSQEEETTNELSLTENQSETKSKTNTEFTVQTALETEVKSDTGIESEIGVEKFMQVKLEEGNCWTNSPLLLLSVNQESTQKLSVCNETNVNITLTRSGCNMNHEKVDLLEASCSKIPKEEEVSTPVIKRKSVNYENHVFDSDYARPKTDIAKRTSSIYYENVSLGSSFDTYGIEQSKANSFFPTSMYDRNMQGSNQVNNREEFILSRIESARKNVGINNKTHTGSFFQARHLSQGSRGVYGCHGQHLAERSRGVGGACGVNLDHCNINLLSKKFNQIIGKTDYLLEQLNCNGIIRGNTSSDDSLENPNGQFNLSIHGNRQNSDINCGGASSSGVMKVAIPYSSSSSISTFSSSSSSFASSFSSYALTNLQNRPIKLDNIFSITSRNANGRSVNLLRTSNTEEGENQKLTSEMSKYQEELSRNFDYAKVSDLSILGENPQYEKVLVETLIDTPLKGNLKVGVHECVQGNELSTHNKASEEREEKVEAEIFASNLNIKPEIALNGDVEQKCMTKEKRESEKKLGKIGNSVIDPELVEVDFYVNEDKLVNSFSLFNAILGKWSGIPIISRF
ncbi:hypothetical protein HWI79_1180 [Cryptosporidium felis]|nr:hypothetical protein HWI79_1180 [Cryptosporidium felis]